MRLPPTGALEAFCAVAEAGGLANASKKIGITMSAISQRLFALEELLGVSLFDRSERGLSLTAVGYQYLARVKPLIAELKAASTFAVDNVDVNSLSVASPASFYSYWLAPRIPRFLERYPDARIDLFERSDDNKSADISIEMRSRATAGRDFFRLFKVSIFPICTTPVAEHLQIQNVFDIERAVLITTPRLTQHWEAWFDAAGIKIDKPNWLMMASMESMFHATNIGLGVGLTNSFFGEDQIREGLIAPFSVRKKLPGGLDMKVMRGDRAIVRSFSDWLRAEVRHR